jgi:hypothetical protein
MIFNREIPEEQYHQRLFKLITFRNKFLNYIKANSQKYSQADQKYYYGIVQGLCLDFQLHFKIKKR